MPQVDVSKLSKTQRGAIMSAAVRAGGRQIGEAVDNTIIASRATANSLIRRGLARDVSRVSWHPAYGLTIEGEKALCALLPALVEKARGEALVEYVQHLDATSSAFGADHAEAIEINAALDAAAEIEHHTEVNAQWSDVEAGARDAERAPLAAEAVRGHLDTVAGLLGVTLVDDDDRKPVRLDHEGQCDRCHGTGYHAGTYALDACRQCPGQPVQFVRDGVPLALVANGRPVLVGEEVEADHTEDGEPYARFVVTGAMWRDDIDEIQPCMIGRWASHDSIEVYPMGSNGFQVNWDYSPAVAAR